LGDLADEYTEILKYSERMATPRTMTYNCISFHLSSDQRPVTESTAFVHHSYRFHFYETRPWLEHLLAYINLPNMVSASLEGGKATAVLREIASMAMPEGTVDHTKWWKYKNLRTLNLLLFFPLLSIFTLGFVHPRILIFELKKY